MEGFDAVGVTTPDGIGEAGAGLEAFLAGGMHGEMGWLETHSERRRDPRALWPDVLSIIMLGMNYGPETDPLAILEERWRGAVDPVARPSAQTDRLLGAVLPALLLVQLVLGAAQRHLDALLMAHMLVGVAFVAPLALQVGFRAWGLNAGERLLQRLGLGLIATVGLQILLGLGDRVQRLICMTEDISESGVLLSVNELYPAGTPLEFSLPLPGEPRPLRGTARISRSTHAAWDRAATVAAHFDRFHAHHRARLEGFLQRQVVCV